MPEKIRAIRFLTFPQSWHTHLQWTHVRSGTIQTGFHTQSSRSSLSPAFLWNKIGLIICILTLRWHKRWWECVHKATAQKTQPVNVFEGHNLCVCDLSVSQTRLFASLTGCMPLCSSRAAECGCIKQTLINFYYTLNLPCVLFTGQSHPFSSHCMSTQMHTSTPRMHWELCNTLTGHEWKSNICVYCKNEGRCRFRGCRWEWKEENWKKESRAR